MLVYIASPYAGNIPKETTNPEQYIEQNLAFAKACCRFAMDGGYVPIAPHLMYPQFLTEKDREKILSMDLELLCHSDALWVFGKPTPGMEQEIVEARKRKLPITYYNRNMQAVLHEF